MTRQIMLPEQCEMEQSTMVTSVFRHAYTSKTAKRVSEWPMMKDLSEFEYGPLCCYFHKLLIRNGSIWISSIEIIQRMFLENEMIGTCVEENALLWSVFTVVTSNFWAPFFSGHISRLFARSPLLLVAKELHQSLMESSLPAFLHIREPLSTSCVQSDPKKNWCSF